LIAKALSKNKTKTRKEEILLNNILANNTDCAEDLSK
jgi:hypothetical protein